ncbi:hypothetical protein L517_1581 [Bordetella bronchiseptica MBORD670]|nr:hypothetical protein L517_1581 [Bordetella bronchiseptica MBORD670]KDD24514.1 hypothetical protein L526_1628 [Bordetella bronchiseptica MBORD785]
MPGSGHAARARTSVESECQPARAAHGGPAGYGLRRGRARGPRCGPARAAT